MNKVNLMNKIHELKEKVQRINSIKESVSKSKNEDSLSKSIRNKEDFECFKVDYKSAVQVAKSRFS